MSALEQLRASCSPDVLALNPDLFGEAARPAKKQNKYNARRLTVDGMTFDSKGEYRRWLQLCHMQQAGLIADLQRQVRFVLQNAFIDASGKKQRAVTYTADYTYQQQGIYTIEDFKSPATCKSESFRVRWRMLLAHFKDDPHTRCVIHTP